jgi:outer membrane immunogenic protein
MRKLLAACVTAAAFCVAPALAADMAVKAPPPAPLVPAYNWTGFYLGGNLGGGWADSTVTDAFHNGGGGAGPGPAVVLRATAGGVIGGGQIGYNWQTGKLVLGAEADVDASSEHANTCVKPAKATMDCVSSAVRAFGTVRGRLGFAADRMLFYGTGGFAWQDPAISENFHAPPPSGLTGTVPGAGTTATRVGYAVGAGFEMAIWDRWIGGVEYLYINTGVATQAPFTFIPGGPSVIETVHLQNNLVRARLSYRF